MIIKQLFSLQVYEDDRHFYLVMELMKGGELFDRLKSLKYFSEREASSIMFVIVSTVNYLHQNGVSWFLGSQSGKYTRELFLRTFCCRSFTGT
jgi:serine/threonine protein kinase